MARQTGRRHNPDRLHNPFISLVGVVLASLGVGIVVGSSSPLAAALLVGTITGVLSTSILFRMKGTDAKNLPASAPEPTAATSSSVEEPDATAITDPEPEALPLPAPHKAPSVDITPSVTDLDDWDLGENPPSLLDFDTLSERIVGSSDPIAELKLFVGDIRTREAQGDDLPSPFERYAARLLIEAGLFGSDVELPSIRIVRPPASNMFYLRIQDRALPYLAKLRILSLEAALNAIRFSHTYFDDPDARPIEEHYQLLQKLTYSIAAQTPSLAEGIPISDDALPDTEWAVRMGISTAIETFQLPHRLAATWRVNVADGNVAFELELPPDAVFPATRFVDGLGLVATSREMRRKAASDYALKLALLVANAAFRCSELIKHVWVAGTVTSAQRTSCLLSVDFDRWRFSRLDLSDLGDLTELYRSFAPMMRYEDGILRPVAQTFSLDEQRFCPLRRYEALSLSTRKIAKPFSDDLGCERVSGLAIDEAQAREFMATDIASRLGDTTEHNVRLIMELAGDNPDPSIRGAAERTVTKLIEGTIDDDASSITKEFLAGDPLSRAVEQATKLLAARNPEAVEQLLATVLDPLDEVGIYADTSSIEYRFFPNYVERALYNRLFALEGHLPQLVPRAYFQAHFLMSTAQLIQGSPQRAIVHARRLVELAPLDARSHAHLVRCLEFLQQDEEAVRVLHHLLEVAHDPEGLGIAYYRMAYFQWKAGHTLAAQACYQLAMHFMPPYAPVISMEMGTLALQNPGSFREDLSDDEARQVLRDQGIPIAPTDEMSEAFLACARASLDAEIFPVARNFAWILGAFTGDDILVGLLRSMEDYPSQPQQD